jgi:DNA end-binding protein Ku
MPRAIWTGSISFGLVNAPVRMYAAISESELHFHFVHTKDAGRIGYQKVCKEEDRPVLADEIAKAYELDSGELVYMTDEDFEAAEAENHRTIAVQDFVPYDEIDPIYFERTYYLGPQDGAERVYALLVQAMERTELAAIATYVFHDRENLGCLRVRDGVITLEKMYFADEVRPVDDLAPADADVGRKELEMATDLIDRFAGSFDIGKYHDTYRERLLAIIEQKAKGEEVHAPKPVERDAPSDLVAALEASLRAAKDRGGAGAASGGNGGGRRSRNGGGREGGRRRGGDADDLAQLPKLELEKRAKKAGISGRSSMTKAELAEALADEA